MRKRSIQSQADAAAATARRRSDAETVKPSEVSSARPRVPDVIPLLWHDRLLLATVDLPVSSGGEAGVVEAMLNCVSSILGSYAVGACLAADGSVSDRSAPDRSAPDRNVTDRRGGESASLIFRRLPGGRVERLGSTRTNARLFPGFKYEYVAPVPGPRSAPTLHIASDDDDLELEDCPAVHLLDRAAVVLAHALPKARAAVASGAKGAASALERRMMQADKLATFGQLAAGVVHELNNPLTSIVAYSDYLIRKVAEGRGANDPEDLERLRRISESANRMLRFTRELVGYARPSNGVLGAVPIHRVIDQAIAFCEHLFAAAGMTVERRYVADALEVQGVAEQLVQVFVNLLTNACQAAPEAGGRVAITTGWQDGTNSHVVVMVEDNGCGIAPENLQHLFVPFFTTKRETHGTGLGLSIIKNIVASHDGTIRVESQLGQGTRFAIELPALF